MRVDDDLPLDKAVLVGCGVPTGWGSAVYAAKVEAGDTVVVYGIGGIGINAVQGARFAGAKHLIAVDPLENKREMAQQLGATHAVASGEEAMELALELTRGVGADKAIITVDVVDETVVQQAFDTIRKGGAAVITGLADPSKLTVHLSGAMMTLFRKEVKGTLFGNSNPTYDIPKLLDLYRTGRHPPRRADHQDVSPGRGQRGLRRPAGRQERPRDHRPRQLSHAAAVRQRISRSVLRDRPIRADPEGQLVAPPAACQLSQLRSLDRYRSGRVLYRYRQGIGEDHGHQHRVCQAVQRQPRERHRAQCVAQRARPAVPAAPADLASIVAGESALVVEARGTRVGDRDGGSASMVRENRCRR